jgi:hypothetical protein
MNYRNTSKRFTTSYEFAKRLKLAAEFDRLERKLRRVTRILEDLLREIW